MGCAETSSCGRLAGHFSLWYYAGYVGVGDRGEPVPLATAMETKTAEQATPRRRSTRILLRVPLIVNAVEPSETEWEPVETITVSKHGAMIRTQQDFRVGDTLEIRVRNKDRWARARVAWKSSKVTPQGVELGFEILDHDGFWDISFPPDRWSERPREPKLNP
jgi:hypothetical protein